MNIYLEMKTENKVLSVNEFLDWLEENTLIELTEYEQDDYGEGDGTYHRVDLDNLVESYEIYLLEGLKS